MSGTYTATIQVAVSEDSNITSDKASHESSTYKQQWYHDRRDESSCISPADETKDLIISDFASISPLILSRRLEIFKKLSKGVN